jgi:hypothetical protein
MIKRMFGRPAAARGEEPLADDDARAEPAAQIDTSTMLATANAFRGLDPCPYLRTSPPFFLPPQQKRVSTPPGTRTRNLRIKSPTL